MAAAPVITASVGIASVLKPANLQNEATAYREEHRVTVRKAEIPETQAAAVSPKAAESLSTPETGEASHGAILRRGLPRAAGGAPWPDAGFAPGNPMPQRAPEVIVEANPGPPALIVEASTAPEPPIAMSPLSDFAPREVEPEAVDPAVPSAAPQAEESSLQRRQTTVTSPVTRPRMIGSRLLSQWIKLGILGVAAVVFAAAIIVLAARGVTTLPGVPEFLKRYPGEYHLPAVTDPGFPTWARWTHFLNFFLMILIIRSGWQVRTQQKPPAFWTPKSGGKKISINLWLHTSLDILWMTNGVVFIVLLFASGHWARIVPTSWEVFPNAASAMLQYLTLEWPVENGWVNYNSLQQIMYFLVVFVAAPLAVISGVRMSEWWPGKAEKLNKLYPAPLARAIHFPTMLFFVLFIVIHVFLVLSTGALRNLNHMFAGTDVVNWVGFWLFAGGLLATVAVVLTARPLVIAPIASLFGKVSNR
ncbi:thiosulfate reductase cytochrome b subunit [Leucobacter exalbidus]|uniref:Thiosulfate reductase cytochrome b subunit n=1 Tax=Leucobacter exalbidus TaxID=662960 RepID=A0A940PV02_9MICO|nr:cytochrome b/b6 domain-containing protein [Leucobacter exalbidus]MBP1327328.1 thiosulfate reductase cytochrome b subunit [Leucobacter exalbidus]